MQNSSTFQVYNASAGSGKTFTLVKEYLKIILQSEDIFKFQKILAVTFTNKAAAEMKNRLIEKLENYSDGKCIEDDGIYNIIITETNLDKATIIKRSQQILDAILKNYTSFSITTIDSFTHKIIKNFAYDLGLSLNFEVEMDGKELLSEAVDMLISKIGTDKELTKLLIDFSLEKVDDDRAWDISRELNEFSGLLLNETDSEHFKSLATKSLNDFYELRKKLLISYKSLNEKLKNIGQKGLQLIENAGLDKKSFNRGTIYSFFEKLSVTGQEVFGSSSAGTTQKHFETKTYCTKSVKPQILSAVETIISDLNALFLESNNIYRNIILVRLALKNIIPLAVLNNINSELNQLKEDNNIRLIAEFNQLISENIKDQPAPFIYERIGQRFSHYFIDEMQDTSVLQWQNMIPLIENVLAQTGSDLMLVGDGKQAIYRWRGGKAEQFIGLGTENADNPFPIEKEVKNLGTNFRSYSEIIKFTNDFFQFSADYIQNNSYKELYINGNKQLENKKKGGCVTFNFLPEETEKEEKELRYPKAVLSRIKSLEENGFLRDEICILVRNKKDGIAIANYLISNDIEIVSSETLLLSNSPKVNFMIDIMQSILHPKDEETIFNFLYFLSEHFNIEPKNKHQFLLKFAKQEITQIFENLTEYGVNFSLDKFQQFPLYEKTEYLIRSFNLLQTSDAYVQFFLDTVLERQQKGLDLQEFLEFWQQHNEKLSIAGSDGANKVSIMTIHKSKGLEFPVVIFPCDENIYKQINPKIWLDDLPETFKGFDKLLLNYTKEIENVNQRGAEIHQQVQEELELDSFNLLYVALTRPIEQLHIITDAKAKNNHYSTVFQNYVESRKNEDIELFFKCDEETNEAIFGNLKRVGKKKKIEKLAENLEEFVSIPLEEHSIELLPSSSRFWDTERGEAISYGNKIHEVLSKINYADDVENVLNQFEKQGVISSNEKSEIFEKITKIVNNDTLKNLYQNKRFTIYNEREILSSDGHIFIPDRLVFDKNNVFVIDYKTGDKLQKHKHQIKNYANILENMGYNVVSKILIYLNDDIEGLFVN